jgi:hypothetical protein
VSDLDQVDQTNFENMYKRYLGKEFNGQLKERSGNLLYEEVEEEEDETKEEKKIIMEMYNDDNYMKQVKQSRIQTQLSKNPPVPRAKDLQVHVEKTVNLPLLKNLKKNEDFKEKQEVSEVLKERVLMHQEFIKEFKAANADNRPANRGGGDINKRLQAFMTEKGIAKKHHYRKVRPN